MTADDQVVGMIGPLYESLVRSELPVANGAHLAMLDPANTEECLTQEPPDGHCSGLAHQLRPSTPNNYFRVITTRLAEGLAGADFAARTLGKRHAFVVDDQSPAGHALAREFSVRFHQDGGALVESSIAADLIYVAGSDIRAIAATRRQLAADSPNVPLIGSEALANDQYAKAAADSARGSYYALAGVEPSQVKRAARFLADYQKAYGQQPSRLALPAFDAATILERAIGLAIDAAGGHPPSRLQVLAAVSQTTGYLGLMGTMGFDTLGDTTLRIVSIYEWLAPTQPAGQFVAEVAIH